MAEIFQIRVFIMRAYHPQPTVAQHAFPESRIPPVRHSRRKKDTRHSKSGMGLICSFSGWVLSPNERRAINLYGGIYKHFMFTWASLVAFSGKESICKQVTQIWSLGWENPLEKEMETHSSIFLPGDSQGQRSLAGYSPWGRKKLDMTEATWHIL